MEQLIERVIEVKYLIEQCDKNSEIDKLNKALKHFLMLNCTHIVETDDIDISPDESRRIKYCTRCMCNLDNL